MINFPFWKEEYSGSRKGRMFHEVKEMSGQTGKLQPERLIEKTVSMQSAVQLLPQMDQYRSSGITVINSFL